MACLSLTIQKVVAWKMCFMFYENKYIPLSFSQPSSVNAIIMVSDICFMVESYSYHKLIDWPLPLLSLALNLHHKFVVEMLSIRIRGLFPIRGFRVKVIFGRHAWGCRREICFNKHTKQLAHISWAFYNERFKNVWRLQKRKIRSFSFLWTFLPSREHFFDDEKFLILQKPGKRFNSKVDLRFFKLKWCASSWSQFTPNKSNLLH